MALGGMAAKGIDHEMGEVEGIGNKGGEDVRCRGTEGSWLILSIGPTLEYRELPRDGPRGSVAVALCARSRRMEDSMTR